MACLPPLDHLEDGLASPVSSKKEKEDGTTASHPLNGGHSGVLDDSCETDSTSSSSNTYWTSWIAAHTAHECLVPADYGLGRIAAFLGPACVSAHALALEGADAEGSGRIAVAMQRYAAAYRTWPSLDACLSGGIPVDVRAQAIAAGYLNDPSNVLLDVIDVAKARASVVVCSSIHNSNDVRSSSSIVPPLLNQSEIQDLLILRQGLLGGDRNSSNHVNNPENMRHAHKTACMLNNPPYYPLQTHHPAIVVKLLQFAQRAWTEGDWSASGSGPLEHVKANGIHGLSIRVIELWEYSVGGGLTDDFHYDVDSVITVVVLLNDDFDGGVLRTFEVGDVHQSYDGGENPTCGGLQRPGDAVAFVSHKYHNVTPVARGVRRSLVMELWQGGVGHEGR